MTNYVIFKIQNTAQSIASVFCAEIGRVSVAVSALVQPTHAEQDAPSQLVPHACAWPISFHTFPIYLLVQMF